LPQPKIKMRQRLRTMLKVTAAIIEKEGRILIARRKEADRFGGLWEFPGGKVESGETPEDCLRREIREEFGVETRVENFFLSNRYISASFSVEILAYWVTHVSGEFQARDHDEVRWVSPTEFRRFAFTAPDRPIFEELERIHAAKLEG
jgi:8-oxo-dGTP diphosphatase